MSLIKFSIAWSQTSEKNRRDAIAKVLESAVTEFQVDEDDFWCAPDEHGVPCIFFKDGTRSYPTEHPK